METIKIEPRTSIKVDFTVNKKKSKILYGKNKLRGHYGLVNKGFPYQDEKGERNDLIKYNSHALSPSSIARITDKKLEWTIIFCVNDDEIIFCDPYKAGKRIAKLTSNLKLVKNIPGWTRATTDEALEIVVLLISQVEEEKTNYLLKPYLNGAIMVCSLNTESDEFITLEIDKKTKTITLNQTKENEIMTRALRENKEISSIWMLEIQEPKF